ncbi:hypothetical protein CHH60_08700 [Paenibacillus sp. 7523-1]|nr:hypothetical protein CHH60_08700 [Paenibacillus sp. 7523-1]
MLTASLFCLERYVYRLLIAALTQVRVSVWHIQDNREQLMDYGGPIEEYSPLSIKIMGGRYFRNMYEFRVQK